jgi:hypothetical protein
VPWWAIVCCGVFGAVVLAASIVNLVATIRMLRTLGHFGRTLEAVAAELEPRSEGVSIRVEAAAANAERLREAIERMQESRRRLEVLLWAFQDVRRLLGAYRWLTPTK